MTRHPFSAFAIFVAAQLFSAPASQAFTGDTYTIDASHTHVQFSVLRFGFNDIIGMFSEIEGTLSLDQENPENSSVSATIGVASLESHDDTRNGHLLSKFWFNAEEFETIRFQSTAVVPTSDTEAQVTGDLTLLGVTKPVTLNVRLNKIGPNPAGTQEASGFSATGEISRSAFGMITAGNLIGDQVAIRIETLLYKSE